MSDRASSNRREFLARIAGLGAFASLRGPAGLIAAAPVTVQGSLAASPAAPSTLAAGAQETLPTRAIPVSGERIPIIGFGSSKAVLESPTAGTAPIDGVIRLMLQHGGRVVDTSPRSAEIDREFGRILQQPEIRDRIFLAAKVYIRGEEQGLAQMRQNHSLLAGGRPIDLLQIESLRDLAVHWPNLRRWKDAGDARYIGVTVFTRPEHQALEEFMRRESPDFVHMNYSIMEREAEERLLPLAADRGMAVLINRPFMNGEYFPLVQGKELPAWAADFDCHAWSQFTLKYILSNPAVTCVLTETTNPTHMDENIRAGFGRLPNEMERRRMVELVRSF
jgi:diketogulonate reductase-like aldo/keto reductase